MGFPGAHRQVRGLAGAHEGPEIGPGGPGQVAHPVGFKDAQGKAVVVQALGQGSPVEGILRHHRHGPVLGDRAQDFAQDGGVPGAWLVGAARKGEVVGGPEQPRDRRRSQQHVGQGQPAEQGKDHPVGTGPGLPGQDTHRAEHLAEGEKEHPGRAGGVVVGPAVIARVGGEQGQGQTGDGRQQEFWAHQRKKDQGAKQEEQVFPFARNAEDHGQHLARLGDHGDQGRSGAAAEPGKGPALDAKAVVCGAKGHDQGGCHVEIQRSEDDQPQAGPGPALAQPQVQAAKDRGQGIGLLDQGRGQPEQHGQDDAPRGGGGQEAEQDRDEQMVEVEIEQGIGPDREIQGIGHGGQHAVAASGQKRRQGQDQGLGSQQHQRRGLIGHQPVDLGIDRQKRLGMAQKGPPPLAGGVQGIEIGEKDAKVEDRGMQGQVFEAGHDGQEAEKSGKDRSADSPGGRGGQQHRRVFLKHGATPADGPGKGRQ
ncbi:hypothetical protein DVDV_3533 [Desulfovibrio sp. DV]|nr:hypothetical protein DVDV_3533 [Desulfovibrio sp. DV]